MNYRILILFFVAVALMWVQERPYTPAFTPASVERIGISKLPMGTYTLLNIREEASSYPDYGVKHYVSQVKNHDTGKLWDTEYICPPDQLDPIGSVWKVIRPGEVQTNGR